MINKIKLISVIAGALLILGGAFFAYSKFKQIDRLKDERNTFRANQYALQDVINKKTQDAYVLELNRSDLSHSNDSLIKLLESTRKSLKKPKNKPGDVSVGISTGINVHDTTIIDNTVDFKLDTVIKYNDFTKNSIKIENNRLISGLAINNVVLLYVYSQGEYVNAYKNWLVRLAHLDWERVKVDKYTVKMTNDLVTVDSVRVIKVK